MGWGSGTLGNLDRELKKKRKDGAKKGLGGEKHRKLPSKNQKSPVRTQEKDRGGQGNR